MTPRSESIGYMAARACLAYGSVAATVLASLWVGANASKYVWTNATGPVDWELPMLIGWLCGASCLVVYLRLSRTRLVEWANQFDHYLNTRKYEVDE